MFLEPLIEELLELWSGVSTYDAASSTKFNLHAAVLWCIHDFPALSTMSGRTTKSYYACTHCNENPLSQALRNKVGYFGLCCYLPMDYPWRRSLVFDGKRENQSAPRKFTTDEVTDVRLGKDGGKKRKRGDKEEPIIYTGNLHGGSCHIGKTCCCLTTVDGHYLTFRPSTSRE